MRKFKELFVNSFFYCLAIELVEEIIEDIIALGVSAVITKAVSAVIVVSLTQSTKLVVKRVVKKITYKEGNDKMSKIKTFFTWIFANKKSLTGVVSAGVATLSGTGVIDIKFLPTLMVGSVDVAPIIYYGVLLVFAIIGISGKGFEKIKDFFARKDTEKAEKEAKAIVKEAKKEIAQAQKQATQTQAQKEKAEAKAKAEELAKKEKEKADSEHRAKVEEAKRKLLAQNNNNPNA